MRGKGVSGEVAGGEAFTLYVGLSASVTEARRGFMCEMSAQSTLQQQALLDGGALFGESHRDVVKAQL